jgi:hypothetical protein
VVEVAIFHDVSQPAGLPGTFAPETIGQIVGRDDNDLADLSLMLEVRNMLLGGS